MQGRKEIENKLICSTSRVHVLSLTFVLMKRVWLALEAATAGFIASVAEETSWGYT